MDDGGELRGTSAEELCATRGYEALRAWLERTRGWEPLQHLEVLTPRRATADGARRARRTGLGSASAW